MGNDAFSAGVVPGGLKDKQEIKILICFLLHNTDHNFKKRYYFHTSNAGFSQLF